MNDDTAIRERIRAAKLARSRARSLARKAAGYQDRAMAKIAAILLKAMDSQRVYSLEDLEVILEYNGRSYLYAGPVTTYMKKQGLAERVSPGHYQKA